MCRVLDVSAGCALFAPNECVSCTRGLAGRRPTVCAGGEQVTWPGKHTYTDVNARDRFVCLLVLFVCFF